MRVAYLGPPGTFTEDALREATGGEEVEALPKPSVYAAIIAVEAGEADRALVPFENSIEGAVSATLDTLAFDAQEVTIVGEHDLPIRHCLIAREQIPLERIEVVLSHPQASAQCARFIRENLPGAEVRAAESTADAVRRVSEHEGPWAALGAASAATLYGAAVLRDGIEDEPDNVTRFVWVRIESRPLRRGLGRYMFFLDLEGAGEQEEVAAAIGELRGKAESVRILGSYPVASGTGVPGTN